MKKSQRAGLTFLPLNNLVPHKILPLSKQEVSPVMHGGGQRPCTQFWKPLMAQSLKELCCCVAEGPGMFQYIPLVASVTPASIQLGQRPGSLQSGLYSAGVGSSLDMLLPCHSDKITQVGTFSGSPTQQLHPIL